MEGGTGGAGEPGWFFRHVMYIFSPREYSCWWVQRSGAARGRFLCPDSTADVVTEYAPSDPESLTVNRETALTLEVRKDSFRVGRIL